MPSDLPPVGARVRLASSGCIDPNDCCGYCPTVEHRVLTRPVRDGRLLCRVVLVAPLGLGPDAPAAWVTADEIAEVLP